MSVDDVFACYLGPVVGFDVGPPDLILQDSLEDDNRWPDVTWLRNRTFEPLVEGEDGWHPVSWPAIMELPSLPESPATWQYVDESTWVLGDGSEGPVDSRESAATPIPRSR
jgi:hypothetical protein